LRAALAALVAASCNGYITAGPVWRQPAGTGGEVSLSWGFVVDESEDGAAHTFVTAVERFGGSPEASFGEVLYGLDRMIDAGAAMRLLVGASAGLHLDGVVVGDTRAWLAAGVHAMLLYQRREPGRICSHASPKALETCPGLGLDLGARLLAGHGLGALATLALAVDFAL
jgi:hypothetical protein